MDRLTKIRVFLDAHPEWNELTSGEVAEAANTPSVTRLRSQWITERRLFALFAPERAEAILQGFEAAAQVDPIAARALRWIRSENGVDVGEPASQALLDTWAAAGICTVEEAATLKALGQETVSPAQAAGLGEVLPGEIDTVRRWTT